MPVTAPVALNPDGMSMSCDAPLAANWTPSVYVKVAGRGFGIGSGAAGRSRTETFQLGNGPVRTNSATTSMVTLAPAVTFNVATALLGSMNGFDIVQATTAGGPGGTTELVNIFIFRTFGQGLFAQATTMSLVLFLGVALLAFPVIRMLRKREDVL